MPTNCEIKFNDNPDRVYYGGQRISGCIHLILAKEKIVRGKTVNVNTLKHTNIIL